MSFHMLSASEQLPADVTAEGPHPRVNEQVPLQCPSVFSHVGTVRAF